MYVGNNPINYFDEDGERRLHYIRGRLCMANSCTPNGCQSTRFKTEDDGPNGPQILNVPAAGQCVDADGIYLSDGAIIKIPDNCKITIECSSDGRPSGYRSSCWYLPGKKNKPDWNPQFSPPGVPNPWGWPGNGTGP